MGSLPKKLLVFCLLLAFILAANNSSMNGTANMTFAPPPPINTTVAVMLNSSQVDGRFIGSKRIESLELMTVPGNATANLSTNFKLSYYNRNAPNNRSVDVYSLNLPGNWSYVTGTQDTLSCNVIHEANRDIYGLIQFLSSSASFKLLAEDFLSIFTSQTPMNVTTVASALKVGDNCNGVYFNNVLYKLIPGTNNLTAVTVPAGWNSSSTSESLLYGVAANTLYRFNQNSSTY
jgi:hypothetical protein